MGALGLELDRTDYKRRNSNTIKGFRAIPTRRGLEGLGQVIKTCRVRAPES